MPGEILLRVESSWFVCGIVVKKGGRKIAPPLMHKLLPYLDSMSVTKILQYSKKRGWKAEILLPTRKEKNNEKGGEKK